MSPEGNTDTCHCKDYTHSRSKSSCFCHIRTRWNGCHKLMAWKRERATQICSGLSRRDNISRWGMCQAVLPSKYKHSTPVMQLPAQIILLQWRTGSPLLLSYCQEIVTRLSYGGAFLQRLSESVSQNLLCLKLGHSEAFSEPLCQCMGIVFCASSLMLTAYVLYKPMILNAIVRRSLE